MDECGRPGPALEGGEDDRETGDAVKISEKAPGDGEAVEFVRLDDFPKVAAGRTDNRLGEKQLVRVAGHG